MLPSPCLTVVTVFFALQVSPFLIAVKQLYFPSKTYFLCQCSQLQTLVKIEDVEAGSSFLDGSVSVNDKVKNRWCSQCRSYDLVASGFFIMI